MYMLPMLLAGVAPPIADASFTMEVPAAAGKSPHMLSDVQDALANEASDKHPIGRVTRLDLGAREPRPTVPLQQLWEEHEQRRKDRLSAAQRAEEERVAGAKAAAQAKRERKGAARLRTRQLSQAGGDPSSPPKPPDDNR